MVSPQVLVVCKADAELVSLEPDSLRVRWRADLSDVGHEVVASPGGALAYVPLYGTGGVGRPGRSGDGVDVVDLHRGVRTGTIPLPRGCRPHFADWGRDGNLFITAEGTSAVLSVDVTAWECTPAGESHPPASTRELKTGHDQTHMLAVALDGGRVYTAEVRPGGVTELEVQTGRTRSLRLAEHINRISLSPDGTKAYVADQEEPRLAVVDVRTMTVDRWISLPSIAFGTAACGAGHLVLAMRQAGRVTLLDTQTGRTDRGVSVPDGPQRVVVTADGRTVYVTCAPADVVVAVDVASMRITGEGVPGRGPDGLALCDPR